MLFPERGMLRVELSRAGFKARVSGVEIAAEYVLSKSHTSRPPRRTAKCRSSHLPVSYLKPSRSKTRQSVGPEVRIARNPSPQPRMAPIIANHSFLQSLGMRFAAFQHATRGMKTNCRDSQNDKNKNVTTIMVFVLYCLLQ